MIALVRGKISPPDKSSSVWFPPMPYSFADRVSPKVQNDRRRITWRFRCPVKLGFAVEFDAARLAACTLRLSV